MIRALLQLVLICYTILPNCIHGYCIYNKMTDSTVMQITQVDGQQQSAKRIGKRFAQYRMSPTSVECCAYTNPDCSEQMTLDAIVKFSIGYEALESYSREIEGRGGGYIVATGTHLNTTYTSYDVINNLIESIHVEG